MRGTEASFQRLHASFLAKFAPQRPSTPLSGLRKSHVAPYDSYATLRPVYTSGDLVWTSTAATAPHWVLLLDGPSGVARRRLAPQAASTSQLRELIRCAFHADTGVWPVSVTVTVVRHKQRLRFQVVTS
jgi:hypothetical protein